MKIEDIFGRLASETQVKEPKVIWDLLYTFQESDSLTQESIISRLLDICQQSIHNPVLLLNKSVQMTPDNTKLYILNFLVDLTLSSSTPDKIFDLISYLVFYCDLKKAHIEHLTKKVIKSNTNQMLLLIRFFQLFLVNPKMPPPYSYFYFNGANSGISLNSSVFPFKKALTMCAWVRIEKNQSVSRLFTFHCRGAGGLEAYFVDNKLYYRSLGPEYTLPARGSNGINLCKIEYQTWTFVAFYHKSKDSLHKSQLKVVVNDLETLSSVMDFPNVGEKELTMSAIACDFYGQISCMMFFTDVVQTEKIKNIFLHYNLGPHSNESLISLDKVLGQGLEKHLYLLIHPERTDKGNTYSVAGNIVGSFMGISGSKTFNPRKSTSLGGILNLLPILSHIFELEDTDLLLEWFRLLTFCLKDRPSSQNEAVSTSFFKILSVLLEKIPDFMLSEEILNIIDDLKNCGNKLPEQIFTHLLWNFSIWMKSDTNTQVKLFHLIKSMYSKNKSLFKTIGIDLILQNFKEVKYDKSQETYVELIELALFSGGESATECFIRYLSLKPSTKIVTHMLKTLKTLISSLGHASIAFLRAVQESKGTEVVLSLLPSKNVHIKQLCVQILETLITSSRAPASLPSSELPAFICKHFNPDITNRSREFDSQALDVNVTLPDYLDIGLNFNPNRNSLQVKPITPRTSSRRSSLSTAPPKWDELLYHCSLEIMLNRVVEGPNILDDSDLIQSSLGLQILMHVASRASSDIKHRALQDQLMLTKWNNKNCALLMANQDWHFWLLNLVLETFDNAEAADAIVDIGIRLHNIVLVQAMELPEGFGYFVQMNTWLEINSVFNHSKNIIRKVLENFTQNVRKLDHFSENHWKNFIVLGFFLEEFILYSNCKEKNNLEEGLNYNKYWEDLHMVSNYLNLIRPLWSHSFGSSIEEFLGKTKEQALGKLKDEAAALNFDPEDFKKRGKFGGVLFHIICHSVKATEDERLIESWLETLVNLIKLILYVSEVNKKTLAKQEARFYSYCIAYTLGFLCQAKQKHPCSMIIDNFLAQILKLTFASLSLKSKKTSGIKSILKINLVQYYYPCDYIIQMISRTNPGVETWVSTVSNFSVREIQQYLNRPDLQNALFYLLFQVQSFFHNDERTSSIIQEREKLSEKLLNDQSMTQNQIEFNHLRMEDFIKDAVHEIRVSENSKIMQKKMEQDFKSYKRKQLLRKLLNTFKQKHDETLQPAYRLENKICRDFTRPFLTQKSSSSNYITAKNKQHYPEGVMQNINFKQIKRNSFLTEEEELDLLEDLRSKVPEDTGKSSGFSSQVGIVTPMTIKYGYLFIKYSKDQQKLVFRYDELVQEKHESGIELFGFLPSESNHTYTKTWQLSRLTSVFTKSYLMKPTAIELIFADGKHVLLNFFSQADHIEFILELKKLKKVLPNLKMIKPKVIIKAFSLSTYKARTAVDSNMTDKWVNGQISNFEYLMYLNYCAGRSYNDLTQYPVMPWVVCDYSSDTSSSAYRDLGKNMGSLGSAERIEVFNERFRNMQSEGSDPPFHFGSHYSNPGITLFYLVRLAPFDECAKELQGGKFDLPDRLFHSLDDSYFSAIDDIADVRELIPEFFYLPEMLLNLNKIDFGKMQSGRQVSDVKLPPWADNAYDFTRIHREILESEAVSANLHKWIDLIFGYKQQGIEAEKAMNVFYYLTYESNVDIEKVTEPDLLRTLTTQMYYFGRTPTQIFTKPHPMKKARISDNFLNNYNNSKVFLSGLSKIKQSPYVISARTIVKMKILKDKEIHCIRLNRSITRYSFNRSGLENSFYFSCEPVQTADYIKESYLNLEDSSIPYFNSPFSFFNSCKSIAMGGFWDGRIQIRRVMSGEVFNLKFVHSSTVTCIEISENDNFAVSGSKDGECVFWVIKAEIWLFKASFACHDDEVTCIAISEDLGVFATSSYDGFCNIYSIYGMKLMNQLNLPNNKPISVVKFSVSAPSQVFLYCPEDRTVYGYSLNGVQLNIIQESANVMCISILQSPIFADVLVYGNDKGEIIFRNAGNFEIIRTCSLAVLSPIVEFVFTSDFKNLLVGCVDGEIAILTQ